MHGANPHEVIDQESGRTILMEAALRGYEHMVGLLLESGADPKAEDSDGLTASDHAFTLIKEL